MVICEKYVIDQLKFVYLNYINLWFFRHLSVVKQRIPNLVFPQNCFSSYDTYHIPLNMVFKEHRFFCYKCNAYSSESKNSLAALITIGHRSVEL